MVGWFVRTHVLLTHVFVKFGHVMAHEPLGWIWHGMQEATGGGGQSVSDWQRTEDVEEREDVEEVEERELFELPPED